MGRQPGIMIGSGDALRKEAGKTVDGTLSGYSADAGTETYRGFVIDNVYHSPNDGDIHYNVYIPESYDGSRPYALFFTLPGYEGLYFQGVARNLEAEAFGFEAQKYNGEMIVVAPQLSDWRETSADQTIALLEYFLDAYNIDREKVYANGYSGGGETMSLVMGKRPELFTAYLHCSSQWDGDLEVLAESRTPVYLAIGEDDEYYGSEPTKRAYDTLRGLYEDQGLTDAEIGELLVLDVKDDSYFRDKGVNNQHGGGVTNQAFAAAGLIDELSIVLAPTADGESGSASLFETGGFSSAAPVAFSLKAVEKIENDTLWLRYISKNQKIGGQWNEKEFRSETLGLPAAGADDRHL